MKAFVFLVLSASAVLVCGCGRNPRLPSGADPSAVSAAQTFKPFSFAEDEPLKYHVSIETTGFERKSGRKQSSTQRLIYHFKPTSKHHARLVCSIQYLSSIDAQGKKFVESELPPDIVFGQFDEDGSYRLEAGQGVNDPVIIGMQFPRIPAEVFRADRAVQEAFRLKSPSGGNPIVGTKTYKLVGREEIDGHLCQKFQVEITAASEGKSGDSGYGILHITTTAWFLEEIGNYYLTRTQFHLENRVVNDEWDIDKYTVEDQEIEVRLKTIGGRTMFGKALGAPISPAPGVPPDFL